MRMLVPAALVAVALLGSLDSSYAEDEAGWRTHAVGANAFELALPDGWTVLVDTLDGRLTAASDDRPAIRLVATVSKPAVDASLEDLRQDVLGALFGWPADEVTIEDEVERAVGGQPALWTLLAYEGASGARRILLVVRPDLTLRFDVEADAFPARRPLLVAIADTLRTIGRVPVERDMAEERSAASLEVEALDLLHEFLTHVPRTRAELAALAATLGRKAEVDDALAVLDDLIESAGPAGGEVLALVGWHRFDHPLPEALHYRGHAFLRTVEEANAQRWFGPDERPALDGARRAWADTQRHIEVLESDHRYRAADQMLANLAHHPALRGKTLVADAAPPFLVVYPADPGLPTAAQRPIAERLADEARVLADVHRRLYDGYGDRLGLEDLSAPYGGRPDLPLAYRSYPDGVVLAAIIPPDEAFAAALLQEGQGRGPLRLPRLSPGRRDLLVLAPEPNPEATAVMGAKQLLLALTRQRSRWGEAKPGFAAVHDGFARWLAVDEDGGRLVSPEARPAHRASMRALARALADADRPYPLIPLRQLVAFGSVAEAVQALQRMELSGRLPRRLLVSTLFDQSWALATFLHEAEDGRWRDAFLETVRAGLNRELGRGGLNEAVFARAFALDTASTSASDWKALEAAWERFVRKELLGGIDHDGGAGETDVVRMRLVFERVEGDPTRMRVRFDGVEGVSFEFPRAPGEERARILDQLEAYVVEHFLPHGIDRLAVTLQIPPDQIGRVPMELLADVTGRLERLHLDIGLQMPLRPRETGQEPSPHEPDQD